MTRLRGHATLARRSPALAREGTRILYERSRARVNQEPIPGNALSFSHTDRDQATVVVHGEVRDERSGGIVREFTEALKFG